MIFFRFRVFLVFLVIFVVLINVSSTKLQLFVNRTMFVSHLWSAKAVSDKMKQLINSSDLRYHTILGVSCYIEEAYSYFVLCYLTYLSVVAFNGVGGVYRLRIAGVYWKCSVRRSQLSHHDFMTMGYVSPHLRSSVSNCVSAVSLLTAPYTVLRSRRNSF